MRREKWTGRAGLAWVFLLVLAPRIALAEPERDLAVALEHTDQVITRADSEIAAHPDQLANDYLDQARQFQRRARSAFAAGLRPDAQRLTQVARRRAFAAISLADQAGGTNPLPFAIGRTDAFLDRVAPFLSDCPNDQASDLFRQAQDLQRQAKDALQMGRPRVGLSMTNDARALATRALRTAEASCGEAPDRAPRAVQRTDQLLQDSAWLAESGSKAAQVYDTAVAQQQRAKGELGQGHYPDALQLTLSARDQLVRALSRSDRPLAKDAVAEAVKASAGRLDQARGTAHDPAGRSAVEEAAPHQSRAQDLLERGQLAPCLAEVHAVRTILERAGL
jgi:hypothetical protein